MPLRAVVLDIEGTTSATAFVVERLYPYSAERFTEWVGGHRDDPDVARAVAQARDLIGDPAADTGTIVAALSRWLAADQKIAPLKTLQGKIWAHGFASGDLVSHFFPDVIPALRAWHAAGLDLYVFSSGSVPAQRGWFAHSPEGNLLPLMSGFFDTENAGPKRETGSYRRIAAEIGAEPAEVVFLSDLTAELDAAREAGWHTVAIQRPGEPHHGQPAGDHPVAASFDELSLSGGAVTVNAVNSDAVTGNAVTGSAQRPPGISGSAARRARHRPGGGRSGR